MLLLILFLGVVIVVSSFLIVNWLLQLPREVWMKK